MRLLPFYTLGVVDVFAPETNVGSPLTPQVLDVVPTDRGSRYALASQGLPPGASAQSLGNDA